LEGIQNIVSTLFLAESRYDIDVLMERLLAPFESEEDKRAVSLFLNWFKQLAVHGRIAHEDYAALEDVYRSTEEVHSMLITAFEREKRRYYQEGREEGRLEIVLAMYRRGFDLTAIADITGIVLEEIQELIDRTAQNGES
jgi:hypothetical protein